MNTRASWLSKVIVGVVLVAIGGCASKRTPPVVPGTEAQGLPPVPIDLRSKVTCVDVPYNVRCAAVPSGMNNCMALMRAEADQRLAGLLGKRVRAAYDNDASRAIDGSEGLGSFEERARYVTEYTAAIEGHMAFRLHESPVYRTSDGVNYSMRVCVVSEEAEYQLWTDIADRANRDQRPDLARLFVTLRREHYGEDPPDRGTIEGVERDIAEHFESLWRMASPDREKRR